MHGVAAAAGTGVLAGCGQAGVAVESSTGAKSAAPVNLSFATLYKEDPSWNLSRRQLAKFEAKFPHIKVHTDWITGSTSDYLKKVQTYLAGGTQPDVLYMHYLQTAIFGSQGVLLDLSKYTSQDKAFKFDDFIQGVADHFRYKDKPVGIAWYSGPHTLLFNKTLFQKAGVKTPEEYEKEGRWTWETMREVARKLTRGTPGSADRTIGLQTDITPRLGRWERFVWQSGGELFNQDKTKSQFTSPAAIGSFEFVADLMLKERVVVMPDETSHLVPRGSAFTSGKVAMQYGIPRDAMTVPVDAATAGGFELGLVPLPKGKSGRQNLDGPQGYGVGAASNARDAAWELVKWWTAEDMQAERLELGASVPVRKSMQRHKSFVGALRRFESAATLEEAAKTVRAPYSPANLGDLEKVVDEQWNAVVAGKNSVRDALNVMAPQVDRLLAVR